MQPRTKEMPTAVNRPRKSKDPSNPINDGESQRQTREANTSDSLAKRPEESRSRNISAEEIAKRAYQHWESEGKPTGKHFEHWVRARAELEDRVKSQS